jgi:hypothetical protein
MSCEGSFENYIRKKISDLQLINIQDVCIGIAVNLHIDFVTPDGILTKAQLKDLENAESVECFDFDGEFLEKLQPVQDWLVKKVCKAIQKKEIKPLVLRLEMNGDVDPKRTYVQDHKILRWFGNRGIETEVYCFKHDMYEVLGGVLETIYECIINQSQLLSDAINMRSTYRPKLVDLENNYSVQTEISELEQKVKKLQKELDKLKQPPKTNNYAERHSKNREPVLGAALSVLASYPEKCKNKSGKLEATKIRTLIEEKAFLFWPEREPSLSTENIERLLREWLKKTA